MSISKPVPKEKASRKIYDIYNNLEMAFGHMPNVFGVMAHHPDALKTFLPFYKAIMSTGTVDAKYKELAYLKTSQVNGCEY